VRGLRPQPGIVQRLAQDPAGRRHRRAGSQRRRQVDSAQDAVRRAGADGGSITFAGAAVQDEAAERRVQRGLGYVPQEHAIFAKLSVRENLLLGCIRQPDHSGIDYVLDFFPKLAQRLGQTAGTLSGGERKMLAIGRAVLGKPRLLMLDEPTEGVWVGVIEEIADRLRQLSREMAVILVEQHIELALDLAQYAYVIDRGHVALEGAAAAVKSDAELIRHLAP